MRVTRRRCLSVGIGLALLSAARPGAARQKPDPAGVSAAATPALAESPQASPMANPWEGLRRPLRPPALTAGTPCPVTRGRAISPDLSPAAGTGPAYAIGLGRDGVLSLQRAPTTDGWYGAKVLWVASPAYQGPVLVRGGQVGGSGELGFAEDVGEAPQAELRLPAGGTATPSTSAGIPRDGASGWSFWPSHTYVRAAGCDAFQLDGTTFSEVIVFATRIRG